METIAVDRASTLNGSAEGASTRRWSYRVAAEVPYWNARTYRALLRATLTGNVISGREVQVLTDRLRALFRKPVLVCGSGRTAMALALAAARVGDGDEVIVPTFCCESVLHPIFAVRARPVFADVGANLMLTADTVEAACSPRTRAVIVPHMFGNPAPIGEIADVATKRGVMLLDDAAQGLGGEQHGQPLGGFGDAGIISFGNGKICFGTGGGALVSGDSDLMTRARAIPLERPRTAAALLHVSGVTVWRTWRRHTVRLLNVLSARGMVRRHPPLAWGAARNIDAAVALTLLDTLASNITQRRARVSLYAERLAGVDDLSLFHHAAGSACLTQVVRVSGTDPSSRARAIIDRLRAARVEAMLSFTPLHLTTRYRDLAVGPLPEADTLADRLIELPAEPHIPLDEIARIADVVIAATA